MVDKVIPFIGGEEEKSEIEPMKVWGSLEIEGDHAHQLPVISSQCIRVPVSDGHMAAVFVSFRSKPSRSRWPSAVDGLRGPPQKLDLPSAPRPFLKYFAEDNRPQTRSTAMRAGARTTPAPPPRASVGAAGRPDAGLPLRLSVTQHDRRRCGGAVLTAELLKAQGYITAK